MLNHYITNNYCPKNLKRQCILYEVWISIDQTKNQVEHFELRFREFVDRTVNEFAIAHEDTFKKLPRRNVPILRFHTLSNHVGAVEDRMNRGYWPMKSSWSPLRGSIFAVMGRQPRKDRSLQETVCFISNLRGVKAVPNITVLHFSVLIFTFQRDPFPDDFTNEITGRKLKSLPVEKNRAIGFEMFMDRSLFDNWVSLLRVIMAFNVENCERGRKRERGRGREW